jgi:flagellar biosynthesis/type III secretory pathway protein FliH
MKGADTSVEVYRYAEGAGEVSNRWPELPTGSADSKEPSHREIQPSQVPGNGDQAREKEQPDLAQSFEEGRRQGLEEGRQAERLESAGTRAKDEALRKEQISSLMTQFASGRDRYLRDIEHEVVELSLAVAARILRHEAQIDPLLLTGAVRVALGQLAETTKVTLRVPQADLALWKETMVHIPNLPLRPMVLSGDHLRTGECLLETEMGSVDLGMLAQLAEIERGFFDGRKAETGDQDSVSSSLNAEKRK